MPEAGFDPPLVNDASNDADDLPPSHHGWKTKDSDLNPKKPDFTHY